MLYVNGTENVGSNPTYSTKRKIWQFGSNFVYLSMKYIKEELEKLILTENKSYAEIGRKYNVSGTYVKKVAIKLGINLPKRSIFPKDFVPANKGEQKYCQNCGIKVKQKFCSKKCQGELRTKNLHEDFLKNNEKYCRSNYSPKQLKPIFLQEQGNMCAICGIKNEWFNKSLIFVLDHIDGDASNNTRENLRLVCPNCDSQLDTFKSKNKNSARKERYLRNEK